MAGGVALAIGIVVLAVFVGLPLCWVLVVGTDAAVSEKGVALGTGLVTCGLAALVFGARAYSWFPELSDRVTFPALAALGAIVGAYVAFWWGLSFLLRSLGVEVTGDLPSFRG